MCLPADFPAQCHKLLAKNYPTPLTPEEKAREPALNKSRVEEIVLPLPPLEEQVRIVSETERVLSIVAFLESCYDKVATKSAALRSAVLRDAFTGQLVPQDPTDEPASVLLERIRAEWASHDSPKRNGRARRAAASKEKP